MSSTRGRQVVVPLTNKSGGAIIAGDVVVIDTSNDTAFTTTTTGRAEVSLGIAQESIANNATGRVLVAGYAALVNVPASVTRGHYLETHTVAKQAAGNGTRRSGSFGQFFTGGTTPTAWLWGQTDQTASGGGGVTHAYAGYNTTGGSNETMTSKRVYAKKITLASAGTIVSVGAAVKSDGASHVGSLGIAVYADNAGTPGKLLGYVMPTVTGLLPEVAAGSTSYGWVHIPLGLYCAAGDYWLAVFDMSPTNTIVIAYDGSGTDRYYTSGGNWVTDWGFYTPTTSANKYSIRASVLS